MRLEDAQELVGAIQEQCFAEYRNLGGTLSREEYTEVVVHFIKYTLGAFVLGEGSRDQALKDFTAWLRSKHSRESVGLIFSSVDNVHAYT